MKIASIWKVAGLSLAIGFGMPSYTQAQIPPSEVKSLPSNDVAGIATNEIKDRSYSYGAMMAKGLQRSNLTPEEKNLDAFIEGFKKGLEGDQAALDKAQNTLRQRLQGGQAATGDAAKDIAFQLGVTAMGGLAVVLDVSESAFDFAAMREGFQTVTDGKTPRLPEEQMNKILQDYFKPLNEQYQVKLKEKQEAEAAENIKAGQAFLAENAKKEGVVTLPSGLQYQVLKAGTGAQPTAADKVRTHYHGTLIDGKVFDSSVERGEPITFPLNGVIQGWQEGIPLMKEGAKYRLFIPQELAYGMASPSPSIPAGATLIFEVELLEVNPGEKDLMRTIQAGKDFLANNAKKEGVVTLPSGLQYEVVKKGNSDQHPTLQDRVKVHYHGTLADGSVFDSSVERGAPATFGVGQVIQGWQEGIPLMTPGAKYRFYIPQELAYGTRSPSPKIPAGAMLIFDVELFEINPGQ